MSFSLPRLILLKRETRVTSVREGMKSDMWRRLVRMCPVKAKKKKKEGEGKPGNRHLTGGALWRILGGKAFHAFTVSSALIPEGCIPQLLSGSNCVQITIIFYLDWIPNCHSCSSVTLSPPNNQKREHLKV